MLREKIISGDLDINTILTTEEQKQYLNGSDCFKLLVSKKFMSYEINQQMNEELTYLKKIESKISSILTTNYDNFLNGSIFVNSEKFISQDDLYFCEHTNYAEIYKLHGDVDVPNSIIVTSNDYKNFQNNLKLLTAKVMTLLCDFPIIFIGYSLSDENIKAIFYDFINSFGPDVKVKCKDKFIFVEYLKAQNSFIEGEKIFQYKGSDITVKTIKTDNFVDIYKYIDLIKPVNTSLELREIKKNLKNLVVASEKGEGSPFNNFSATNKSNAVVFEYKPSDSEQAVGIMSTMEGFAKTPDELNLQIFKEEKIDYLEYATNWFELCNIQNSRNICVFTIKANVPNDIGSIKFNNNYNYKKEQFDKLIQENGTNITNTNSSNREEILKEVDLLKKEDSMNKFANICSHVLNYRLNNKLTNVDCHDILALLIGKRKDIISNSLARKLMSFYDYLINYNMLSSKKED